MEAQNRVTGIFKVLFGIGMGCSAAALALAASWWAVPAGVAGATWFLSGAVQAVTGAGEDY